MSEAQQEPMTEAGREYIAAVSADTWSPEGRVAWARRAILAIEAEARIAGAAQGPDNGDRDVSRLAAALRRADFANWSASEVAEKVRGTLELIRREAHAAGRAERDAERDAELLRHGEINVGTVVGYEAGVAARTEPTGIDVERLAEALWARYWRPMRIPGTAALADKPPATQEAYRTSAREIATEYTRLRAAATHLPQGHRAAQSAEAPTRRDVAVSVATRDPACRGAGP